jgi:D-alanyl-D-alanine carboxypeptidase
MRILKIVVCFFVFVALIVSTASAQMIPQKLDSLLSRTLDSMHKVLKSKSLSAAIQLPNGAVWVRARGTSSEVPFVPVQPDDTYLIGSVVKTITSACIVKMAEENKLSLDDPLHKWLDTFPFINPKITVRQLLQHNSGIYDVLKNTQATPILLADRDSIWAYDDLIRKLIKPAPYQPGAIWDYSNTNYFLLGMIIEKIAQKPYYEELRTRFFNPLGLNSFKIPAYEGLPSKVAHVWLDLNGDNITDDGHTFYSTWNSLNATAGSAGGYYATAADAAKWIRAYMRGDLISENAMKEVKKTIIAPGQGLNYGLGIMERNFINMKGYGHGGDLSYSASCWYYPTKDISITVLCNDAKYNSWTLLPTVTQLLRTYTQNEKLVNGDDIEAIADFNCSIFPNPIQNNSTIQLELGQAVSSLRIEYSTILGERIKHFELNQLSSGTHYIPIESVESLSSGLHFISFYIDNKRVKTVKVLKN